MYLAGYIHRDISTGNLLLYAPDGEDSPRGLINDLEYAKLYTDDSDPGVQTVRLFPVIYGQHRLMILTQGTPHFMALEIYGNTLLRLRTAEKGMMNLNHSGSFHTYKPRNKSDKSAVVKHDWAHDLESFFWILTWFHVIGLCT
jgi:serine/threonine protein kinase